jgi:DNA-binding MarR family transcriptional regulator
MPKKKKNLLNKFEKAILVELNKSTPPLSVNAIADNCGISYTTAKKYIDSLIKKNLITKA